MRKLIRNILTFNLFAICIFSCQVGLGEKVDIEAPSVKIASPERNGYILETFTAKGTAKDDTEIASLSLVLEQRDNPTEETTVRFRTSGSEWQRYNHTTGQWEEYTGVGTGIAGSKSYMDWSVTYTLDGSVENGSEYIITAQVYDKYGNESKETKDEVAVTVDKIVPNATVKVPSLTKNLSTLKSNSANYKLKDNTVLTKLINGEFTVSGSEKEEGSLDKVIVYLDAREDTTLNDLDNNCIMKKVIKGDNLRNWSTTFKLYEVSGYEHDKKYVRVVTESHDTAGNIETVCQGWFVYWNDADIPWVSAIFGGDDYAHKDFVYPSCSLQGQAYDDDGLSSVTIKLYKGDSTVAEKTEVKDLSIENYPKYKAWSIDALAENTDFRIEASCVDIKGNVSTTVKRYLAVKDVNPPSIKIETDTSEIMLGDRDGNVTIEGYATDDGGITSVKLVKLANGLDSSKIIKYYTSTYSEWDKASTSGTKDANGSIVWKLDLTDEDSGSHLLVKKSFKKTFNIFNDFKINGTTEPLKTQSFVIMAVDNGNCAKIDSFTFAGDTIAPSLTIEKLTVYTSAGTKKEDIDFPTYNTNKTAKMLKPYNRNSDDAITDKIEITGSWSDNSTNYWNDKTRRGPITIEWEGVSVNLTVNDNGTWTTGKFTPPDVTTAVFAMEFKDYAGNVVKANENFFVSSNDPELLRITAEENDGSFMAGKVIHIILEFNKAVEFSGGTTPTLTLNVPVTGTKKIISYSSGNSTAQHVFNYTVASGEDIDAIEVESINTNGNTWIAKVNNKSFEVKNMSVPAKAEKKLTGSRTLCIDTKAPTFSSLKAISSAGSYKQNKEIFIQAEFNEEVNIADVSKLKLNLNTGDGVSTSSAIKTGPKTVLFTYKVGAGQNTPSEGLKVNSITISGAGITDVAGNSLVSNTVPTQTGISSIIVDTEVPAKPTISGITDGSWIYSDTGVEFTVGNLSSDATIKKYSVDGGNSWVDYGTSVSLSNNGEYKVTAYQEDAAGNRSQYATAITVNVDKGNVLTSITAGKPTGIYTTGNVIPIYLNFRKDVTVSSGATLTLNNGKTATYSSAASDATRAVFNYTVAEGDSSDGLDVTSIDGTFKDENPKIITDYVTNLSKISGKNLLDSRTLKVITGKPVLSSASLNNGILKLEFSTEISKGSGSITITHGDGYRAPGVLSVDDFNNFKKANSAIANYYELGTNGSDADGVSDITEKYILAYTYDITNTTVTAALATAGANKVVVPVNSSYVTVNGKNLLIELKDSYKLPVKGASYTISIPANLVSDKQNHKNAADSTKTITMPGVESPVIRIKKADETIASISNNSATVTQPLTTTAKVECQTPGITPTIKVWSQINSADTYGGTTITKKASDLKEDTALTSSPLTLGSSTDIAKGYIYKIQATATKGSVSEVGYEYAYRSVYTLTNAPSENNDVTSNRSKYSQLWVRGGDWTSGGNAVETFPVSWNTAEFTKVRAMTNSNESTWYWVTWKINTNAYINPLRGDMPDDGDKKGPSMWTWGMQGPIPTGLDKYILYPGQSLTISGNTDYLYGAMSFYKKHCEYRDGDTVVKSMKP